MLFAVVVGLIATSGDALAALTTPKCLVAKRKTWSTLRKCEAAEQAKHIGGKPASLAKCTSAFRAAMTKIDAKAAKAAVACRFRDNGDGTITDFDTGLMWEQKIETLLSFPCGIFVADPPQCVTRRFTWVEAMSQFLTELNGAVDVATSVQVDYAGHSDWRVPSYPELSTILDLDVPGCNTGGACIDPIFGPTAAIHWSSTTSSADPARAHVADFPEGNTPDSDKTVPLAVRAVRRAL